MELATRPWITFAVSLVGAGTIATTPAVGPPEFQHMNTWLAVADSDAVTSWLDVFQATVAGAKDISDHFWYAFFPSLQQEIVNRVGLLGDLVKNPFEAFAIGGRFLDLLGAATAAHFTHFIPPAEAVDHLYSSLSSDHQDYFEALQQLIGGSDQPLLEFLASPVSGILWGVVGPILGPLLQYGDDFSAVVRALGDLDFMAAFQGVMNMLPNGLDAYFNGYGPVEVSLPLSSLAPGADGTITSVNLGGLFSPGGSFFNALGLADGDTTSPATGEAVGLLGSLVEIQQAIAVAIGWDGIGNPIDALFDGGV
ncbi:MAG TPA: hypothetical protein VFQ37_02000 [Mycobacterium sp.]|nr:hypothetical protein [Mycobacterium sp.]